jgi:hypothetical protein
MSATRRQPPNTRLAGKRRGLSLVLAVVLALPVGAALADNKHAALLQPSSTGKAKTARQTLLKQRTNTVTLSKLHPGKTVGGTHTPLPRTIVTKRILPK